MAIYIKKKVNGVEQEPKRVGVIPNGYPARKIAHSSGGNLEEMLNYSTTEHIVGKWKNNNVYEITLEDVTANITGGSGRQIIDKTLLTGINNLIGISGIYQFKVSGNYGEQKEIHSCSMTSEGLISSCTEIYINNNELHFRIYVYNNSSITGFKLNCTVRYTKAS